MKIHNQAYVWTTSAANENIKLDSPAGCLTNCIHIRQRPVKNGRRIGGLNLFTLEEGVKYKTSIGEHVLWERTLLLHAARIRMISFAHVWIGDIVIGAIWHAIPVFRPEVCRRRVRQVIVNWTGQCRVCQVKCTRV